MKNVWLFPLAVALVAVLVSCGGDARTGPSSPGAPAPTARAFQPLEFPFADPRVIVKMASWGIPNWSGSEPHNGIDLVVDSRLTSITICGLNSLSGKGLEVADAATRTPRTCSRVLGNILSHKNLFDSLQRFVNSSSLVRPGIS